MTQASEEVPRTADARMADKPRPTVMMCPFTNPTNRYIQIQKDLYRSIGYDVVPLSIKGLLNGGFFQLFKPGNILAFHWLEYRPFKRDKGTARLSLTGSLLFAFYCSLMLIGRAKAVYFIHDHAVHDTIGFNRRLSMRIIALVRRLADFRVVHAPGAVQRAVPAASTLLGRPWTGTHHTEEVRRDATVFVARRDPPIQAD
jgi:beta-1,4-mannosyltransferase